MSSPLDESMVGGNLRSAFQILQGTAGLVLLIACANVGGLLLAQGVMRQRELAVRAAIGSGRWRIVRQLLTESLVLAVLGAVVCLMLVERGHERTAEMAAAVAAAAERSVAEPDGPDLHRRRVAADGDRLRRAAGMHGSRLDLSTAFKAGSRSATDRPGKQRLRSAFVVLQISTALVLLTGAGLLINTLMRLTNVDTGIDPRNLTTLEMAFTGREFLQRDRQRHADRLARIRTESAHQHRRQCRFATGSPHCRASKA